MYNLVSAPSYALLIKTQFGPNQILVTELTTFPANSDMMLGATFISSSEGYFYGYTQSTTFGQQTGYIMNLDPSLSCISVAGAEQN